MEHTSSKVLKSIESVKNLSEVEERLRIQTLQWGISNAAEVDFGYYYSDSPPSLLRYSTESAQEIKSILLSFMTNQGYVLAGYIFEIDEDTVIVTKGIPLYIRQNNFVLP